jgi:hypothetical protein
MFASGENDSSRCAAAIYFDVTTPRVHLPRARDRLSWIE